MSKKSSRKKTTTKSVKKMTDKKTSKTVVKKTNQNKLVIPKKKTEEPVRKVVAEIVDDEPIHLTDIDQDTDANSNIIEIDDSRLPVVSNKGLTTNDPLTMYLNEIRKYPLLTKEQEEELTKKYYDTKDPAIAQKLVRSNLRFVVKVAAEYARFSNRMIDLIQEGNVGLLHAVKEYNPYKGAKLITYAVWWIRGYIQEYLMRQFSMVRIGTTANQRKLFYQLQKQKNELEKMMSPDAISEMSKKLGIPEDEINEMAKRLSYRDVSLDKPTSDGDESSTPLSQLLKKEDGSLPLDEQMALDEQIELLKKTVDDLKPQLNEKEKILLEERILSDDPLTLQEIGDKYKITREAVRQTEARLMKKIKDSMLGTKP